VRRRCAARIGKSGLPVQKGEVLPDLGGAEVHSEEAPLWLYIDV
jgi:hypothetical protein